MKQAACAGRVGHVSSLVSPSRRRATAAYVDKSFWANWSSVPTAPAGTGRFRLWTAWFLIKVPQESCSVRTRAGVAQRWLPGGLGWLRRWWTWRLPWFQFLFTLSITAKGDGTRSVRGLGPCHGRPSFPCSTFCGAVRRQAKNRWGVPSASKMPLSPLSCATARTVVLQACL